MPFGLRIHPTKLILLIISLVLVNLDVITDPLEDYVSGATIEGIGLYATARGINAAISVLQTVQLSILVSTVSIGEILDPLNDAIERFSTVLSWSIGSLFAQNFGLEIVKIGRFGFAIFSIGLTSIILTSFDFSKSKASSKAIRYGDMLWRVFLVLFYLRLALPMAIAASMWMTNAVIQQQLETQTESLEKYNVMIVRMKDSFLQANVANPDRVKELQAEISSVEKIIGTKKGKIAQLIESLKTHRNEQEGFNLPAWVPFVEGDETEINLEDEISAAWLEIEEHETTLNALGRELECQNLAAQGEDCRSVFERIKGTDTTIFRELDNLVADLSESLLLLISAIVLKTVVLPLLTVWAILKAMKPTMQSLTSEYSKVIAKARSQRKMISKSKEKL